MKEPASTKAMLKLTSLSLSCTVAIFLVAEYKKEIGLYREDSVQTSDLLQGRSAVALQGQYLAYESAIPVELYDMPLSKGLDPLSGIVDTPLLLKQPEPLQMTPSSQLTVGSAVGVWSADDAAEHLEITKRVLKLIDRQRRFLLDRIDKQASQLSDEIRDVDSSGGGGGGDAIIDTATLSIGDLIYVDGAGDVARLPVGTDSQVLTVDSAGLPVWDNSAGGGSALLTQSGNGAIVGGDQTGDARGITSLDLQSNRLNATQVASGDSAVAVGWGNAAPGFQSIALGIRNTSNGNGYASLSAGYGNTTSSYYTSAVGLVNNVSGSNSSAFGSFNTVSAGGANAFGLNITNNIANSTMVGPSNTAKLTILSTGEVQGNFFTGTSAATSTFAGPVSIASGQEYRIDGVGVLTRQGNGAVLGGDLSGNARGINALDLQSSRSAPTQVASGANATAVGFRATASGAYTAALGYNNDAAGNGSTAAGYGNLASGNYSSAVGYVNLASGNYSSAVGYSSTAGGDGSVAVGYAVSVTGAADNSVVFGRNIANNVPNSLMIGPVSTAKLTILANGNFGIGTTTPTAQLHTTGSLRFSNFGVGNLTSDADGNITVSSDERLKEIVGEYAATSSIQNLLGIDPIQYRWASTTGYDTDSLYAGFSAQNVAEYVPEAVGEDSRGFLTLSDRPLLATVINAVKEMWAAVTGNKQDIEELQRENDQLRAEIEEIKDELGMDQTDDREDEEDEVEVEDGEFEETEELQDGEQDGEEGTEEDLLEDLETEESEPGVGDEEASETETTEELNEEGGVDQDVQGQEEVAEDGEDDVLSEVAAEETAQAEETEDENDVLTEELSN